MATNFYPNFPKYSEFDQVIEGLFANMINENNQFKNNTVIGKADTNLSLGNKKYLLTYRRDDDNPRTLDFAKQKLGLPQKTYLYDIAYFFYLATPYEQSTTFGYYDIEETTEYIEKYFTYNKQTQTITVNTTQYSVNMARNIILNKEVFINPYNEQPARCYSVLNTIINIYYNS